MKKKKKQHLPVNSAKSSKPLNNALSWLNRNFGNSLQFLSPPFVFIHRLNPTLFFINILTVTMRRHGQL